MDILEEEIISNKYFINKKYIINKQNRRKIKRIFHKCALVHVQFIKVIYDITVRESSFFKKW